MVSVIHGAKLIFLNFDVYVSLLKLFNASYETENGLLSYRNRPGV